MNLIDIADTFSTNTLKTMSKDLAVEGVLMNGERQEFANAVNSVLARRAENEPPPAPKLTSKKVPM